MQIEATSTERSSTELGFIRGGPFGICPAARERCSPGGMPICPCSVVPPACPVEELRLAAPPEFLSALSTCCCCAGERFWNICSCS
ncbi:MAG: hypothetical protein ACRD6W_10805, partial [Nitrososphaerales archaeon]